MALLKREENLLLLGNTDGLTTATSSLGVLTTNLDTPVVAETTVSADLLQTLKILTELVIKSVGQNLRVLAVTVVLLSVQEPVGDLVLARVLDNSDDLVDLLLGELTSAIYNKHNTGLKPPFSKRRKRTKNQIPIQKKSGSR